MILFDCLVQDWRSNAARYRIFEKRTLLLYEYKCLVNISSVDPTFPNFILLSEVLSSNFSNHIFKRKKIKHNFGPHCHQIKPNVNNKIRNILNFGRISTTIHNNINTEREEREDLTEATFWNPHYPFPPPPTASRVLALPPSSSSSALPLSANRNEQRQR